MDSPLVYDFSLVEQSTEGCFSAYVLNDYEFGNLIKTTYLLRIAQLRYIIKKYKIPVTGNKTKLVSSTVSIFYSMRNSIVLSYILNEFQHLMEYKSLPFFDPQEGKEMVLCQADSNFVYPKNHTISIRQRILCGPYYIDQSINHGSTTFVVERVYGLYGMFFRFQKGRTNNVSIRMKLNGFLIESFPDDHIFSPLDLTPFIYTQNTLIIESIKTENPVILLIQPYKYIGVKSLCNMICGRKVDLLLESPKAKSTKCQHCECFDLVPFLSFSLAKGEFKCPHCNLIIEISDIIEESVGYLSIMENFSVLPELFSDQMVYFD